MTFQEWAQRILGDNPNWRESGDGELARQAYAAGRESMREECLQECSAEATDNGTAQRIAKAIEELK